MGAFALAGWLVWGPWQRACERKTHAFEQTLTQLLTGQRAWDAPTLRYLVQTASPEALLRLRATLRFSAWGRVYWYGKSQSRPGRKLGHVTLLDVAPQAIEHWVGQVESLWLSGGNQANLIQ